jgi:RNA polymerase sigma-70 factor (ECF subfamily)
VSESADIEQEQVLDRAVENLRRGIDRERSFRVIFDHFFPIVQAFLSRRVNSPEDRLDLNQEIFLRVYRGIAGYRGDAQIGTWVFRIAYNTWAKWLRRKGLPEIPLDLDPGEESTGGAMSDPPMHAPSALDRVLAGERRDGLMAAVAELPDQMRRCVELRLRHDLSYREIAAVLNLSIETVKVHFFQARKKLRRSLEESELDFLG